MDSRELTHIPIIREPTEMIVAPAATLKNALDAARRASRYTSWLDENAVPLAAAITETIDCCVIILADLLGEAPQPRLAPLPDDSLEIEIVVSAAGGTNGSLEPFGEAFRSEPTRPIDASRGTDDEPTLIIRKRA